MIIIPRSIPAITCFSVWCFLMRIASCHTIMENARDTANNADVRPCVSPTAVVSALVNAECALGIPPHLRNGFLVLEKRDLLAWAMNQAVKVLKRINFMPVGLLLAPLLSSLALLFWILSLCLLLLLPAGVARLRLLQSRVFCLIWSFLMLLLSSPVFLFVRAVFLLSLQSTRLDQ